MENEAKSKSRRWKSCFFLLLIAFFALLFLSAGAVLGVLVNKGFDINQDPPAIRVCQFNGQEYSSGASFAKGDGCNICVCGDGAVACTDIACSNNQPTSYPQSLLQTEYLKDLLANIKGDEDWTESSRKISSTDTNSLLFCSKGELVSGESDGREANINNNLYTISLKSTDNAEDVEDKIISYLNTADWKLCRLDVNDAGGTGIYIKDNKFLSLNTYMKQQNSYLDVQIEY